MKKPNTEYFYFTQSERRGAMVLILLAFSFFILPSTFPHFFPKEEIDFSAFKAEIEQFVAVVESPIESSNSVVRGRIEIQTESKSFPFNPNEASKEIWIELGIAERTASTILNYRNKGGQFLKKEDLLKIYGFREEDYKRLEPFILLKNKEIKEVPLPTEIMEDATTADTLFEFDPNSLTRDSLLALGLKPKLVSTIINYRNKGGKFFKKEDLKKIYGLSEETYLDLEPYISIKSPTRATTHPSDVPKEVIEKKEIWEPVYVDINKATIEEWQALRGIGPGYSKRIVNFRDKLGGFASIAQIGETYGLPDSTFQHVKPYLQISPIFKKIQVNSVSVEALKAHPYFSYQQANGFIKYRINHGHYKGMDDLKKIGGAFKEKDWERLAPYLEF